MIFGTISEPVSNMQWILLIDAATAGLVAHHGLFIRGEWHLDGPKIVFGHVALSTVVWWYFLRHMSTSVTEHICLCSLVFGVYLLSLFSSIIIYRLFFHPLRHFPGPRFAAASKFWHIFKCRNGKNFRVLEDLRHLYGQFVRTGELPSNSNISSLGSSRQCWPVAHGFKVPTKSPYSILQPSRSSKLLKAKLFAPTGTTSCTRGLPPSSLAVKQTTVRGAASGVKPCQSSVRRAAFRSLYSVVTHC